MTSHAGAGAAGNAESARVAATTALLAAAERLDAEGVLAALQAGARIATTRDEYCGTAPDAAWAVLQAKWGHNDATTDALRASVLRTLAEHDGFADASHALATLRKALVSGCGPDVVVTLLHAGARADDATGNSPLLHWAKRSDSARALVAAGANVHIVNYVGNTVMHSAVIDSCHPDLVRFYLEAGVGVDTANNAGITPLGLCARAWDCNKDALRALRELLTAGADPVAVDHYGVTPVDRALKAFRSDDKRSPAARIRLAIVRRLLRAQAWHRRQHLVLAVRYRYSEKRAAAVGTGTE